MVKKRPQKVEAGGRCQSGLTFAERGFRPALIRRCAAQQRRQLAFPVQCMQLVAAANALPVYKNLRHGSSAIGAFNHFFKFLWTPEDFVFSKRCLEIIE